MKPPMLSRRSPRRPPQSGHMRACSSLCPSCMQTNPTISMVLQTTLSRVCSRFAWTGVWQCLTCQCWHGNQLVTPQATTPSIYCLREKSSGWHATVFLSSPKLHHVTSTECRPEIAMTTQLVSAFSETLTSHKSHKFCQARNILKSV